MSSLHGHVEANSTATVAPIDISDERPPTPPLPPEAWHGGRLRKGRLHGSIDLTASEASTAPTEEFAVFDVYHHSRVLSCHPGVSDAQLAMLALQQTPQIGGVYGFRRVRHNLPGLPTRQIVLWGDLLPNAVVLPVSLGAHAGAICTVEALHSYSALQLIALACRTCQLPDFLVEAVADGEAVLWINEQRTFPTDPFAATGADSARLLGHSLVTFLGSGNSPRVPGASQASSSSSSSSGVRSFLRPLADTGNGIGSHFVVFGETQGVHILPIPGGASLADLVHRAFGQFPRLGPRCGHRLLRRPIPGFPNLQVCIWDNLEPDRRVLQFLAGPGDVWTIRCPSVASPCELASLFCAPNSLQCCKRHR